MGMRPKSFSLSEENIAYISDQWKGKGKRNPSHWLDDLITHLREKSEAQLPVVKKPVKRFAPPSQEDVARYMFEKLHNFELSMSEGEKFVDFYSSKNWMVGKTKMKDWKAAVRNWLKRNSEKPQQQAKRSQADVLEDKIRNFQFND